MAVGESSPGCASGVLATADGGQTWTPTDGPHANGWRTAAILPGGSGVVAGARGELGILGQGQLLRTVETLKGLRSLNAVSIDTNSSGWMVGDGGWGGTAHEKQRHQLVSPRGRDPHFFA